MDLIRKAGLLIVFATVVAAHGAFAADAISSPSLKPLAFQDLWIEIDRHSPAQRGAEAEVQAARSAESRASRYMEPQVYATGRVFNTNDPTMVFMSRLSQREIESKDFTPSKLNEPTPATVAAGTLGIAVPVYEGGLGSARTAAAHEAATAAGHNQAYLRVRQYAESFAAYGTVLAYRGALEKLEPIFSRIESVQRNYELGRSTNPVGYAGLLALQGLTNRLRILTAEFTAQVQASSNSLSLLANLDSGQWQPEAIPITEFARRYAAGPALAPVPGPQSEDGKRSDTESYRTRSLRAQASSALQQVQIERAEFLPKVKLFAEGNSLTGDRGTGNSYLAGASLSWTLSAPTSRGAEEEARLRSMALLEQANASALEDRVALEEGRRAIESTGQTLSLLRTSIDLLDEQIRTGERLYASGTLTAGQLADIFSKRIDTVQAALQAELAFVQAHRFVILHSPEAPHGI